MVKFRKLLRKSRPTHGLYRAALVDMFLRKIDVDRMLKDFRELNRLAEHKVRLEDAHVFVCRAIDLLIKCPFVEERLCKRSCYRCKFEGCEDWAIILAMLEVMETVLSRLIDGIGGKNGDK